MLHGEARTVAGGAGLAALVRKEALQWLHDRPTLVMTVMGPLVVLLLSAVAFGAGGDDWPVGLVNNDRGEHGAAFVETLEAAESNTSPYFRVVSTEEEEARALARDGRLFMSVIVPETFSDEIESGGSARLEVVQYNVNTDVTKNTRLRLDNVLNDFEARLGAAPLRVEHETVFATDVPRRTFLASGAVPFAVILAGLICGGSAFAREWEQGTMKELLLAPRTTFEVVLGKVATSTVLALAVGAIVAGVGWVALSLRDWASPALAALLLLVASGTASTIGVVLGVLLRQRRAILPIALVFSFGLFFVGGGFASVSTLPPAARAIATWLPASYGFEAFQQAVHTSRSNLAWPAITIMFALWAVSAVVGAAALRRRQLS